MKQHITIEQLQELTEKQKYTLNNLWKPSLGGLYLDKDKVKCVWEDDVYGRFMFVKRETYDPLLSIGKMIEILGDDFLGIHITSTAKYQVALDIILENERLAVFQDTELCDALWKAVKYVLEVGK